MTSPSELGVIFSSRDGYVWASWPKGDGAVRLGPSNVVTAMMLDFIAQEDLLAVSPIVRSMTISGSYQRPLSTSLRRDLTAVVRQSKVSDPVQDYGSGNTSRHRAAYHFG